MKVIFDLLAAHPHIIGGLVALILFGGLLAGHRPSFTARRALTAALGFLGTAVLLEVLAPVRRMSLVDLLLLDQLGVSSVLVEGGYALLLFAGYRAARSSNADRR